MNFREIAEQDLAVTLEDNVYGFGWPINITDPDGLNKDVFGQANDVAFQIDPQTGQAISGSIVSIAIRTKTLTNSGFAVLPTSQPDKTKKPWIFIFDDISGNTGTFTIKETNPDKTLGLILLELETYAP